jgi:abortive infection bacteriophage resistance protein
MPVFYEQSLWILQYFPLISSDFHHGLLDPKRRIAATVSLKDNVLGNWLQSIAYMRNLCAHHSRMWNRKLSISPKLLKGSNSRGVEPNKLYAGLLTLQYVLSQTAPNSTWTQRMADFFRTSPQIDLRHMGFPPDWQNRLPFGQSPPSN